MSLCLIIIATIYNTFMNWLILEDKEATKTSFKTVSIDTKEVY